MAIAKGEKVGLYDESRKERTSQYVEIAPATSSRAIAQRTLTPRLPSTTRTSVRVGNERIRYTIGPPTFPRSVARPAPGGQWDDPERGCPASAWHRGEVAPTKITRESKAIDMYYAAEMEAEKFGIIRGRIGFSERMGMGYQNLHRIAREIQVLAKEIEEVSPMHSLEGKGTAASEKSKKSAWVTGLIRMDDDETRARDIGIQTNSPRERFRNRRCNQQ
ncbi:hypothetical protein BOTBODRAFT_144005 [Botryobasidium botryosum FD-172 SS1]|uniref:Uncharacterized protein n=1 Tax=Botryobasidium botryosum (strain FD-172 SS1) TaxID=930990 RepID=A0A067MPK4_BOTB1|nr:hypothetical protein BOTBODRAFT_144005 [Botryobasidium botryosum FD-172 SS1]